MGVGVSWMSQSRMQCVSCTAWGGSIGRNIKIGNEFGGWRRLLLGDAVTGEWACLVGERDGCGCGIGRARACHLHVLLGT